MPRTDLGGITHVPTTRRALTGVLALTVAGIAAAGPANDSHAAGERPSTAAASTTAGTIPAAGAAPEPGSVAAAGRLTGLRTGIHPAAPGTVHSGPSGVTRATERTTRRATSRSAKATPRSAARSVKATARSGTASARAARTASLTRRTGTFPKHRLRAEARRHTVESDRRADRFRDVRHRKAVKAGKAARAGKSVQRRKVRADRYRTTGRATGELGRVVEYALDQVGKPYRRNAAGPGSYDCSGLVSVAYRKAGVKLPHSSHGIVRKGKKVRRADLRPGDVVMPQSGHVGIYLGNGKMVHAATPRKGVVVSKMYGFSTARRLM